jgi:hypothetical protein
VNSLGVADANCCFTLIDVEAHGRDNDNSVFSNSNFGKVFSSGDLNIPPIRNIPGTVQAEVSHRTLYGMKLSLLKPRT